MSTRAEPTTLVAAVRAVVHQLTIGEASDLLDEPLPRGRQLDNAIADLRWCRDTLAAAEMAEEMGAQPRPTPREAARAFVRAVVEWGRP